MKDETGYNGWTNHQTWAFKLHIDNNQGDYNYWKEQTEKANSPCSLAEKLKEWFKEVFDNVIDRDYEPTQEAKLLIQDVGNGNEINWLEIANSLITDNKEDKT